MTKAILPTLLCCLCLSYAPHLLAQNEKLSQALNAQVSVSGEMTTDKFQQLTLYTTNFIEPLSYQAFSFLKLLEFS